MTKTNGNQAWPVSEDRGKHEQENARIDFYYEVSALNGAKINEML